MQLINLGRKGKGLLSISLHNTLVFAKRQWTSL